MTWTAADRAAAARRRRGHHLSSATRAKLSKSRAGKKHPHKGHSTSAATRKKLSAALKGKKHKASTKPRKKRTLSAAARKAISARMKGKKHPHKGHPGVHRTSTLATKPHVQRAKAASVRRTIHRHGQVKASRSRAHNRKAQRFGIMSPLRHRKFDGMTNTALLNKKLKTMIHGRKHSLSNKGVLNLSGHHFRRHR